MRHKAGHFVAFCLLAAAAATAVVAQTSPVMATGTNSPSRQLLDDHWVADLGAFIVQSNETCQARFSSRVMDVRAMCPWECFHDQSHGKCHLATGGEPTPLRGLR